MAAPTTAAAAATTTGSAGSPAVPTAVAAATAAADADVTPVWAMPDWDEFPILSAAPLPPVPWPLSGLHWPSLSWPHFGLPWGGATAAATAAPTAAAPAANPKADAAALQALYHTQETPHIALDLVERPDRFVATAEVAGVRASDIDVSVDRDSRIVRIGVVRRRNLACDCAFADDCTVGCVANADCKCTGAAAADAKAPAPTTTTAAPKCDGKCKARAAHCPDCEAKGDAPAPVPASQLVSGCCGHCAGALHTQAQALGGGGRRYRRREIAYGRAERCFRAPADVDLHALDATVRHGLLTVVLPRSAAKSAAAAAHPPLRVAVRTADDLAPTADAKHQWDKTAAAAAAAAADPAKRAQLLAHHITRTAADDNPTVAHERAMRAAVAAAADPRARARVLPHHLLHPDPRAAWAYGSPVSAYGSVLRDALELARDFDLIAHHVPSPDRYNPLLAHEQLMRHAVAAAVARHGSTAAPTVAADSKAPAPTAAAAPVKTPTLPVAPMPASAVPCTCKAGWHAKTAPPEGASGAPASAAAAKP